MHGPQLGKEALPRHLMAVTLVVVHQPLGLPSADRVPFTELYSNQTAQLLGHEVACSSQSLRCMAESDRPLKGCVRLSLPLVCLPPQRVKGWADESNSIIERSFQIAKGSWFRQEDARQRQVFCQTCFVSRNYDTRQHFKSVNLRKHHEAVWRLLKARRPVDQVGRLPPDRDHWLSNNSLWTRRKIAPQHYSVNSCYNMSDIVFSARSAGGLWAQGQICSKASWADPIATLCLWMCTPLIVLAISNADN